MNNEPEFDLIGEFFSTDKSHDFRIPRESVGTDSETGSADTEHNAAEKYDSAMQKHKIPNQECSQSQNSELDFLNFVFEQLRTGSPDGNQKKKITIPASVLGLLDCCDLHGKTKNEFISALTISFIKYYSTIILKQSVREICQYSKHNNRSTN